MAETAVDRRRLILAGVASVVPTTAARARPRPGRLIDVHHHIRPPEAPAGFAKLTAAWSPSRALEQLDRAGVSAAMAYPGPLREGEVAVNRRLARLWNTFGAELARDHPGRFGLFASVPMLDAQGAIDEIAFAYDHLKADGVGLATSYAQSWLGDARFAPVYEALDSRRAVVFVHPADAACCEASALSYIRPGMDDTWMEWPVNTARTILSLMTSGTLRRYPNIRFIFAHGGGVMPLLVTRLKGLSAWDHVGDAGLKAAFPDGVEAEFRSLYFECAQAASPTNIAALRSLVPDSQILFGSDYPFFPITYAAERFRALNLPSAASNAIGSGNALRLLPRWA